MFKEIKESIMKISHQIEISMMQYKLKQPIEIFEFEKTKNEMTKSLGRLNNRFELVKQKNKLEGRQRLLSLKSKEKA